MISYAGPEGDRMIAKRRRVANGQSVWRLSSVAHCVPVGICTDRGAVAIKNGAVVSVFKCVRHVDKESCYDAVQKFRAALL